MDDTPIDVGASSYTWDREKACAYGSRFGNNQERSKIFCVFYPNDCTNFVSQCIWAGYGYGIYKKITIEKLKKLASSHTRMLPDVWACDINGGLSNWVNVQDFCEYVTALKTYGLRATLKNDENPWYYLHASGIWEITFTSLRFFVTNNFKSRG